MAAERITTLQLLIDAENAYHNLLNPDEGMDGVNSYTINGRTYTRENAKDLWDIVKELRQQYASESGAKPRVATAKFSTWSNQ